MEPLRPFEQGNKVVRCPEFSNCMERGRKATVLSCSSALDVHIEFDSSQSTRTPVKGLQPTRMLAKSYELRPAAVCETCVFRSFHVIGVDCPYDFKDIRDMHNATTGQK